MTTLFDKFKDELSYEGHTIGDIERVVFKDKYDLDVEKTFELMEDIKGDEPELVDIVFYGKSFKVVHRYDYEEYESVFSVISLKKPRKTKVYDPYSLVDTVYDETLQMAVPFKTEAYKAYEAKEQAKRKAEQEASKAKKIAELDELLDEMRALHRDPLPEFTIYGKYGGSYAVVPERLIRESDGFRLSKDLRAKLPEEYRHTVDYVGYVGYHPDDKELPKLFGRYTERSKSTYVDYMQDFYATAIKEKLIFPVIGISYESADIRDEPAEDLMKKIISHIK